MSKISHLVFVRHGESIWNAQGRWTGWQDVPLSRKGKKEAKMAALAVKDILFHKVITSDLKRAHQTLEIIKRELNLFHLETLRVPELKERHYGDFTGKVKWEIQKEVGEERFKRLRRAWDEPIPGGETLKDVHKRAVQAYKKHILSSLKKGQNVLVVAHGNSNRALIKHIEGTSDEKISEIEMVTGEVLVYQLDREGKVVKKEKRIAP